MPSPYTKPSAADGKNELKDEGGRMKDEKNIKYRSTIFNPSSVHLSFIEF
jgi:hypothetical protein